MPHRYLSAIYNNAVVLLMLTMLVWAGNAIAGKMAVGHISPMMLTCARWTVAAIILTIIARHHVRRDWPAIRRHLPALFAMGAIGFSLFNGLLYLGLQYTTAINASVLQAGIPLFIFGLNFAIFRTRPLWIQVAGYSLTLVGVLTAAAQGEFDRLARLDFNVGDLILIGAILAYSGYAVSLRAKPAMHWLSFLTTLVCAASISAIPFALYEATTTSFIWPVTFTGWGVIAYTAIFPSILGQGFFIRGNELIGANAAGLFLNLVPIYASGVAILLLGETFHLYHGVALVLVIGGIIIAQKLGARS
jgi:drug/metabolite transporter (DMT)-like permease